SHLSADPLKVAADKISGQIAAALNGTPKADVVPMSGIKRANQPGLC
ncbi:MAG: hypothetical protein HQM02_10645, partial [Magnetococcales bacterium]|nr:hypothetical protein [Magnetococcales bacterium]